MLASPPTVHYDLPVPRSPTQWRVRRGRQLALRLRKGVEALALLHGGVDLGPDHALEELGCHLGLRDDAITLRRYAFGAQPVTVIAPTPRTLNRRDLRHRLERLKSQAAGLERTTAIWSPDEILREPRLANAVGIAAAMMAPAFGDAERLGALLVDEPDPVPLQHCSRALTGRFATERLYGLVTSGRFELVHDRPLGPDIGVRIREPDGCPEGLCAAPPP